MPSITLTVFPNTKQKQKLKTASKVSKKAGINNVKIPQNLPKLSNTIFMLVKNPYRN